MHAKQSMVNAMTVDVEDYFHVAAFMDRISPTEWNGMDYRVEANTHRLLKIFADRNVKSTFFVLGWVAKRSPQLIKEIQQAGHEIASHGMSHKLVYNQSMEEFLSETRDAKALLEDLTGAPVLGYRASTYSITRRSLWALDVLCDLGFKYDSSIFPIRHDKYGIPDAPKVPSVIRAPNGKVIVEFPMSTAEWVGLRVPVSGGGYFRLLPYAVTRAGLSQINKRSNRPFVFYLHPWEIDPEQPRVQAGLLSRLRHYTNLERCESRLVQLLADFNFTSMKATLDGLGAFHNQANSQLPQQVYSFAH